MLKYLFYLEVAIFRRPVDITEKYVQEKHLFCSITFLFIGVILFSLFIYLLGSEGIIDLYYWLGNTSSMARGIQELTFWSVFISIFIKSSVIIVLVSFLLFLFAKVGREEKINIEKIINLLGIKSFLLSSGIFISMIILKLFPAFSLFLFGVFFLFGLLNLIIGYVKMFTNKNKGLYSFFLSLIALFFFFLLIRI